MKSKRIAHLSIHDEAFKTSYIEGRFVIDCLEIKITQNTIENPKVYQSTGYIHVSPENGAEIRIIHLHQDGEKPDPLFHYKQMMEVQSGAMFPEHHYFKLEARDTNGRIWKHPSATVQLSPGDKATVINIQCDYLHCETSSAKQECWSNLVILEDLHLPMNLLNNTLVMRRGAKSKEILKTGSHGTISNLEFVYDSREGRTDSPRFSEIFFKAQGEKNAPSDFVARLLEALRFGTATMFWPVMQETCHGGKIVLELSKHRPSPHGGMIAPPINRKASGEAFYKLVTCYYDYACANADSDASDSAASLSKKLAGLYTIKDVWIDSIALLVSVALEATLNESAFKSICNPSAESIKQIDAILSSINNKGEIEESLIRRATGALSNLKSVRAADKLHYLESHDAINEKEITAWKGLRNAAAHGSLNIKPDKLQKIIDQIYLTMSAIYKLVFIQIGYTGEYTDYSKHGWPIEFFKGIHSQNDAKNTELLPDHFSPDFSNLESQQKSTGNLFSALEENPIPHHEQLQPEPKIPLQETPEKFTK